MITTLSGAIACLRRDQAGCHQQGGYSDRSIYLGDTAVPFVDEQED